MAERQATVGPEEGLHARPAAQFVKTAKRFSSEIVVVKGEREVNAKSVLKMTGLAKKGETITIRAEGEDAQAAVDELAELISADEQ
jgi:phosphotransferase system HPr (HPr) family protein